MGEIMSIWREIWKEAINTGKDTLLKNDQKGKMFIELKEKYPEDAMIILEEAMTFDCMKNYKKAIELYEQAYMQLPVQHWKDTANYYLQKAKIKATGQIIPKLNNDDIIKLKSGELTEVDFKLFGYFNLHSYYHMPHNIRYLAISSLSRIDSEPAIALIIFRTCMEISLKSIFKEYNFSENDNLAEIISILKKDNKIYNMASYFRIIKDIGNEAAHQSKNFTSEEIAQAIVYFDIVMEYLNLQFKETKNS